ncbi:hypothetical protein ACAN107058_09100 [Paracidovorax anthurii]|uniref:Uncharacterized protein n=1 Tax=Paracidovorax anthurii TaxID=78229 RepID=A0A328ZSP6_9BURK|nr:hypothetical protein AX018_1003119 [Paracidovorax anthurii]
MPPPTWCLRRPGGASCCPIWRCPTSPRPHPGPRRRRSAPGVVVCTIRLRRSHQPLRRWCRWPPMRRRRRKTPCGPHRRRLLNCPWHSAVLRRAHCRPRRPCHPSSWLRCRPAAGRRPLAARLLPRIGVWSLCLRWHGVPAPRPPDQPRPLPVRGRLQCLPRRRQVLHPWRLPLLPASLWIATRSEAMSCRLPNSAIPAGRKTMARMECARMRCRCRVAPP